MYESYWKLSQKPFENGCDSRFYYPAPSLQAALLKLRYAMENSRGGALLAGPSGCGKTLVVGMLRELLPARFAPFVHLVFPQMPSDELLAYLAAQLTGSPGRQSWAVHQSVGQIETFLAANSEQGRHAVVVIDEAQLLDDAATLEAIRLLLNFEVNGRPALTLLLAGQTGILPVLDRSPQLEERLGVKCLVRPLTAAETAAYVEHRLKVAGGNPAVFDAEAVRLLYQKTHGVARRINRLCDLALLIGYAEERKTITAAQLDAVNQELVGVAPE